ncbi:MAG: 50S ribosomal protein L15 [Vampirovibrionales bacterium]|nr:50S ribosomal protein L15 [Vampirovibrionales bacterium]
MSPKTSKAQPEQPAAPSLTLETLSPAPGSNKKRNRVGRGRSHGQGKTCGHGHNGEGQRAGQSAKRGFEGGQMPAYRRLPKLPGFSLPNPRVWLELTTGELNSLAEKFGATLDYATLVQYKRWTYKTDGVRLVDRGELKVAVTLEAHYVTPGAEAKLKAAGGTLKLVAPTEEDAA